MATVYFRPRSPSVSPSRGRVSRHQLSLATRRRSAAAHDLGVQRRAKWSPDGRRIVFSGHGGGDFEIGLMAADGSGLRTLTSNEACDVSPVWSPDGSTIAFQTRLQGNWDVALIDPSGENLRVLTATAGDESEPRWTPDGTALVFTSIDGDHKLVTVRVAGLLTAP